MVDETAPSGGLGLAPLLDVGILAGLWFEAAPISEASAASSAAQELLRWWPRRRSGVALRLPGLVPPVASEWWWVFPVERLRGRSERLVTRLGGGRLPDPWCTARFPALGDWSGFGVWLASAGPVPPDAVRVSHAMWSL